MIKVTVSNMTVGGSSNQVLATANYAIVGMVLRTATINGSEKSFWCPALASVDANGNAVSVAVVNKADLIVATMPKLEVSDNGHSMKRFNSGSLCEAITERYTANHGKNIDILWMTDIKNAVGGKVFRAEAECFQARSRKNTIYTAHVYKCDFVQNAPALNLSNAAVVTDLKQKFAAQGYDGDKFVPFDNTAIEFCDKDGNTIA